LIENSIYGDQAFFTQSFVGDDYSLKQLNSLSFSLQLASNSAMFSQLIATSLSLSGILAPDDLSTQQGIPIFSSVPTSRVIARSNDPPGRSLQTL
jgi:hypothetical protein